MEIAVQDSVVVAEQDDKPTLSFCLQSDPGDTLPEQAERNDPLLYSGYVGPYFPSDTLDLSQF